MFDYTMTALQKIKNDFLKIIFACNVFIQVLYVAYLIVALCVGAGNAVVNGILLGLSSLYLGFYLVMNFRESRGAKQTKKIVELIYKWSKRLIKVYTLAAAIYAIILTEGNANHFTVLITAFMLVGFVLQILLEIVYRLVVSRLTLLIEGIKADVAPVTKTVNFFKKLKGDEIEAEPEKSKQREWLDKKVVVYRAARAEEKAAKKLALKEKKAAQKRAKQEEKQQAKQAKKERKN
ncbi:MAG: hypothetical protein IJW60_01170 [Clostridia bacterium]|nr:hypothetical protein [Clostridia bacterium]